MTTTRVKCRPTTCQEQAVSVSDIGRQVQQSGTRALDHLARANDFARGEIVHDDDVTVRQVTKSTAAGMSDRSDQPADLGQVITSPTRPKFRREYWIFEVQRTGPNLLARFDLVDAQK